MLDVAQPHIIIHAAAETDVEKCEKNPVAAVWSNVDMTNHLVEWIQRQDKEVLLVFISTDQLYHGLGPHDEKKVYPRNVYALTKLAAEGLVRNCPFHLIVRVNFVGWSSRGKGFVSWFIDRVKRHERLTLVEDVNSTHWPFPF